MNPPYPGYPPNSGPLPVVGDRHRSCFVIEFRCLEHMSETQKIAIREQLEAYVGRILANNATIENFIVATDSQFDSPLSSSLRLSR
jgi:hypothetical protein